MNKAGLLLIVCGALTVWAAIAVAVFTPQVDAAGIAGFAGMCMLGGGASLCE